MKKMKIGLLPLYLKLYDDTSSGRRDRVEGFYNTIAEEFRARDTEVITSPICRVESEFKTAVESFESAKVDSIVTLHMAYSPSLESAEALSKTRLPIIVLDTTPTFSYGPDQDPEELMYNHGIHGVQDMCNLLIRNGKPFHIEAGHWEKSDVIDRVMDLVRSARMASAFRNARIGLIGGESFRGMGDFFIPPAELKSLLGPEVVPLEGPKMKSLLAGVAQEKVDAEYNSDTKRFNTGNTTEEGLKRSIKTGLAVEKWIEDEKLTGFTFNFLKIQKTEGYETAPFLQASKMMSRGFGYAGEGDTLTASLVSALMQVYEETSFSEMFCPDWDGNRIYLSHMGEVNFELLSDTPTLVEFDYSYTDAENPVFPVGRFKEGDFLLVDLAPIANNQFRLIISPCSMVDIRGKDNMARSVRGWFTPPVSVADFLAQYSRYGGTHHLAVSYGAKVEEVEAFGKMMGWETAVIC